MSEVEDVAAKLSKSGRKYFRRLVRGKTINHSSWDEFLTLGVADYGRKLTPLGLSVAKHLEKEEGL